MVYTIMGKTTTARGASGRLSGRKKKHERTRADTLTFTTSAQRELLGKAQKLRKTNKDQDFKNHRQTYPEYCKLLQSVC